jgi:copper homeostasis protein
MPFLLEAACASLTDCLEAEAAGADRIELCSALVVGGLTPSIGLLTAVLARVGIPVVCMVRPRAGAFDYGEDELETMRRDIEAFREAGAAGVVLGVLTAQGAADIERTRDLVERAGSLETVFHRAFDLVRDPEATLEGLASIGVTRILTSGQAPASLEGAPLLRRLIERAAGRIEILPGGGIRAASVAQLLAATGARGVHLGPQVQRTDASGAANPRISFGAPGGAADQYPSLDPDAIRAVRAALDRLDPSS